MYIMLIIPLLNDYILVSHPDMYCMHLHLLYVLYKIPHVDCLWNHVLVCITLLHCYPLMYVLYEANNKEITKVPHLLRESMWWPFASQITSNTENVSMSGCHHVTYSSNDLIQLIKKINRQLCWCCRELLRSAPVYWTDSRTESSTVL